MREVTGSSPVSSTNQTPRPQGLGVFRRLSYQKFCGESTQSSKRAKAGYHRGGGILPFDILNRVWYTWFNRRESAKELNHMKKCVILKVISILFALMTLLAISCAITGTGSGFLDLSNIARAVCIGIAVICGILAVITWKYAESTV